MKKMMIAIPCMDMVSTEFFRACLSMKYAPGYSYEFVTMQSSLIYDSRNRLAQRACENGFDRVLWLDSDMVFPPDLIPRLSARLDEGNDFVSAMYFRRVPPVHPVIYETIRLDGEVTVTEPYDNYPKNSLFEIAGCGLGACMMNVSMIRDIGAMHGRPFSPRIGFGEDMTFCLLARETGYTILCDSSIIVGHVGQHIFCEDDFKRRK